jgi:cell division protein FtsW
MVFLFLCIISIIEVYSASSTLTFKTDYWRPILKHATFLLVGLVLVAAMVKCPPKFFAYLMFGLPLVWALLVMVKFFGISVNGAQRTIFGVQPSEIAKLCLICSTAFFLARYQQIKKDTLYKIIVGLAVLTCGIIMIDNFSTAAILFAVIFMMMFIGQIPFGKLMKLAGIIGLAAGLFVGSWYVIPNSVWNKTIPRVVTWKNRIVNHSADNEGADREKALFSDKNYQVTMGKIAVARGGIVGVFPGNSQQRDFLPQAYSDFIYAIILEEMGLIGGIFVLILYIILFIRAGIIATRCEALFPKLLVMGCATMIVVQALANMAVAVSLIPVTGQPLPLISRGGNSILVTCALIGIILSVSQFETPKGVAMEQQIEDEFEEERVKSEK